MGGTAVKDSDFNRSTNVSSQRASGARQSQQVTVDYGPLEWRALSSNDMVPRGFEFRMNVKTGLNYAKVPRRLRLPQKDEEFVRKLCQMASWGSDNHLALLRAELERAESEAREKTGSSSPGGLKPIMEGPGPGSEHDDDHHHHGMADGMGSADPSNTNVLAPPVDCLQFAVEQGHLDVIDLLLEKRASCVQFDKEQQTPLHVACKAGNEDVIVKLFLFHKNFVSEQMSRRMKQRILMGEGTHIMSNVISTTSSEDSNKKKDGQGSTFIEDTSSTPLDDGSVHLWSAQACFLRLENGNGKTPRDLLLEQDLSSLARRVAEYIGCSGIT